MRVLVISDIHANLSALDAVIADACEFDAVWCLGDLVGYGPEPNECVERIRSLPNLVCLLGNHDAAALGQIDTEVFNAEAKLSVQWMQTHLLPANMDFLRTLPERVENDFVTLAHGSPRNPVWEYILDGRVARKNFDSFKSPYCLVGHTHLPVMYHLDSESGTVRMGIPEMIGTIELSPRAILNPGSVGQPRDRDNRAAYAIFDLDQQTWTAHRVAYDIIRVQRLILEFGLPPRHAIRLSEGW